MTSWFTDRYRHDAWRSITLIILAIVVANCAFVFLGYDANPIWWTTTIASRTCAWTCGLPTVDPNVGFITQPQGHLAALELLHGHLPWWNYYEGMGQPLAGEMQSAALLPLVLLFLVPAGLVLFHLSLQIIAGVSTYFLLRRVGVGATVATTGAILFALNGTFAWIGNAVVNPIAFMPMTILGIEIILDRTRTSRRGGWALFALAIALSVYAGFPETAYLDGLFAGGWALTRLFSSPRPPLAATLRRITLAGLVGVALALPILVAFYDFVKYADIGGHFAQADGTGTTAASHLNLLINPYLGGTILGGPGATPRNFLGYFTASVAVFAVVGLSGRTRRPLRWFLAGWTLLGIASALNVLHLRSVVNLVPGVDTIALARYIWPSLELAVIVLAALGITTTFEHAERRGTVTRALALVTMFLVVGLATTTSIAGPASGSDRVVIAILVVVPFAALAILGWVMFFGHGRTAIRVVVAVVVCETMLFFAVPTFRNPTSITVATGSLNYLRQHQGLSRFISLGVLTPNWGAQFSLYELNAVDLPMPVSFTDYVHTSLAPSLAVPRKFTLPFTSASQADVATHIANYESLGVKYILTPPVPLAASLGTLGLVLVAHDARSNLYQVATTTSFYRTALVTCVIADVTVDHVRVTCPQATSVTRLELSMAGWTARVNGTPTPISSTNGLSETVAVPAGTSLVSFDYLPPHEKEAGLVAATALVVMAYQYWPRRRRFWQRSTTTSSRRWRHRTRDEHSTTNGA